MHQHQVIQQFKGFNRKEMTRFRAFVYSPYHNKHEGVRTLVDYCSGIFPGFRAENCSSEAIRSAFGLEEPVSEQQIAVYFTYTRRLLDDFLVLESIRQKPESRHLHLLRRLRRDQHFKAYEKQLRKTRTGFLDQPYRDSNYHHLRYRFAAEADAYYTQREQRKKDDSLLDKQEHLDCFYLAEKLKDACELLVRRNILSVNYHPRFLDHLLAEVSEHEATYQQQPGIYLYYLLYRLLESGNPERYAPVIAYFTTWESVFPKEEMRDLYNLLQNYCIQQINAGNGDFLRALFELYQRQLIGGLLMEDGYLIEWHYKNITTVGLRLRELNWVQRFLADYEAKLHPDVRENAASFNQASYLYEAGDYSGVLNLLLRVEYTDVRYQLGAKALLLRTYYDLKEDEALIALADASRQLLQRKTELSADRRKGYLNLFRLVKRLNKLRAEFPFLTAEQQNQKIQKLGTEVRQQRELFNRPWLQEKLNEIQTS